MWLSIPVFTIPTLMDWRIFFANFRTRLQRLSYPRPIPLLEPLSYTSADILYSPFFKFELTNVRDKRAYSDISHSLFART